MSNLNISGNGSGVESLSISSDSSGPMFCNFWNDLVPKLRRANLDRCAYYRKEFQGHEFQIKDVFEEKEIDLKGVVQSHSSAPASNTESTNFSKAAIKSDTTLMDTTELAKDASSNEVCHSFLHLLIENELLIDRSTTGHFRIWKNQGSNCEFHYSHHAAS